MARLLWWNAQNLFDDVDDHRTSDLLRSRDEYLRDVREIAEVIDGVTPGADFIGLTEIENRSVIDELAGELRWRPTHGDFACPAYIESRDVRGIDVVAMARRDGVIKVKQVGGLYPSDRRAVRPVLHCECHLGGHELEIVLVHGKSRRSGPCHPRDPIPGSRIRHAYGELVGKLAENAGRRGVPMVVLGDFNDTPDCLSMTDGAGAEVGRAANPRPGKLYNLTQEATADAPGTHCHRGAWLCLDQVLVNGVLLAGEHLAVAGRPQIATHGPLLYKGKPNRWYSDHLPIILDLEISSS